MRIMSVLAVSLALAACGSPENDAAESDATDATEAAVEAEPAVQSGLGIPAAMHGRWGLVPADCTSTRGDNKGLITVTAGDIRFYESVGQVDSASERSDDAFRARFAFTGEGMQWTREMALALGEDGETLVRTEFGEDAIAEPLTYTKCA